MANKAWRGRLKKAFKVAAATTVVTGAVGYFATKPANDYDDSKPYEPSALQQEFIRLAAQKNYYIAFGDTHHDKPEIEMFAFSRGTVGALATAGKKEYFLEQSPEVQSYFDSLRNPSIPDNTNGYKITDGNMWLCNKTAKERLNRTFESGARENPSIRFVGADSRQINSPFSNMSGGELAQVIAFFLLPIGASQIVHGCVTPAALVPGGIVMHLTGADEKLTDGITDDTPTASYMRSFNEPAAILFGAAHFMEIGSVGPETSMRHIMTKDGRSMAVMEIYRDAAQKKENEEIGLEGKKPDVILYVIPPANDPDGIEIVNPAFQEIYDQALKNIQRKKTPAPPTPGA